MATNSVTGKKYIGYTTKGLNARRKTHYRDAKRDKGNYFHDAIRKYGEDCFIWTIVEDGIDDFKCLQERERYWIKTSATRAPDGYNLTDGGDGVVGMVVSAETRRKMSLAGKGRKVSEETRRRQSLAVTGYRHTEEAKRKMSIASKNRVHPKGHKASDETKRKLSLSHIGNSNAKGYKHTAEARIKMSLSKAGKPGSRLGTKCSEETRRKISEVQKGKVIPMETRIKMSLAHKGRQHSEQARIKMGLAQLGRKHTAESKLKMRNAKLKKRSPEVVNPI